MHLAVDLFATHRRHRPWIPAILSNTIETCPLISQDEVMVRLKQMILQAS